MFSKKVEEFDDLKQNLSVKEKEAQCAVIDKADLIDYKAKYLRECAQRDDLNQKYSQLNEQLEVQAKESQDRIEVVLNEKTELI